MSCQPEEELTYELHDPADLKHAMREQVALIHDLKSRLLMLESVQLNSAKPTQTPSVKFSPVVICLSCLTVAALFKCLIGLEATNFRFETLTSSLGDSSKSSLLPSPQPLAPIVWIGHIVMYLLSLALSGVASLIEQVIKMIMTGVAVTCVVLILLRNANYKSSVCCEPN